MADATIALPPDSTGKLFDLQSLTNGSAQTVYRQAIVVASPTDINGVAEVKEGNTVSVATDGAAVVAIRPIDTGSSGLDFSANEPTWPVVGSSFSAGGLYPSWLLLATVPAGPGRLNISVDNMSSGPILCLRDDGTALAGSAPNNATGFTLNPKVSVGPEGGHYESTTFRGRLQVFGASSSQFVAISTD